MLANDIIGFHTHAYSINFIRCCDELLEAEVDYDRCVIHHAGGQTRCRAFPLGIDAERLRRVARSSTRRLADVAKDVTAGQPLPASGRDRAKARAGQAKDRETTP